MEVRFLLGAQALLVPMTRHFSAGGVVFKRQGDSLLFLLVQPKPSVDFPKIRFGFPKGLLESGEKSVDGAQREVFEETGITGRVLEKIGESKIFYTFKEEKIFKIISYFLIEYGAGEDRPQLEEIAQLLWLPFEEALKKLTHLDDKKILERAKTMIYDLGPV